MIQYDNSGEVLALHGPDGENILYPRHMVGKKVRGGTFVAGPVFGKVPNTPEWSGVNMSRHGLLRTTTPSLLHRSQDGKNGELDTTYVIHSSKDEYPWSFTATVSQYEVGPFTSIHVFKFARSATCENKRQMPLSFGWHPYFAIKNGKFSLYIDGKKVQLKKDLSTAQIIPIHRCAKIKLNTGGRSIDIDAANISEILVWTDSEEYVCVETVTGLNKAILLYPGASYSSWCRVTHN